ncbi:hypothetical protein [Clostridium chauvoei]|uniref:Uncharacterized protein n=1 Tax=Clostridium chauvoei JF4335 TaxID=1351755 RepID=S6F726_9CLOT|nr:hypothetical protein [Clostridium chauvoei]ATD58105.1 hypothetical protein BTM21_10295 [Clostridium chauvoei]MBX7282261.1 hypothetical protein [Clostridium chauvoei]MBX7284711.1 hypothetical protein [Clostridium chauvoei]MBX7287169.1 hypothetical protein [Clostridium chauvoei]MBX7292497.1 hypothetical protein [Clostridium chauvoei]
MNSRKWFSLSRKGKFILSISFYIIFLIYLIHLIINANSTAVKVLYGVILVFFGSFAFLYEVLKKLNDKAIYTLIELCDPYEAEKLMEKLQKYDYLKGFKSSNKVFKLLLYKDMGKYEEIIAYLDEEGKKSFSTSLDLLLVYYYFYFFAYASLKDVEKAKIYYENVMKLKDAKIGRKKILPLFSWNEITGQYMLLLKKYKDSKKAFKAVSVDNMNKHERVNYYMLLSKLYIETKDKGLAERNLKYVLADGNKMYVTTEASKLIKNLE